METETPADKTMFFQAGREMACALEAPSPLSTDISQAKEVAQPESETVCRRGTHVPHKDRTQMTSKIINIIRLTGSRIGMQTNLWMA